MKTHATNCPAIASLEILLSPQRAIIYYTSRSISIDNCFSIHNYGLCSSSRGKKNLFMQTKYTKLCHVNPRSNQIGIEWKKKTDIFVRIVIEPIVSVSRALYSHLNVNVVFHAINLMMLSGYWEGFETQEILFKNFIAFFSKISWYVKEFYIYTK